MSIYLFSLGIVSKKSTISRNACKVTLMPG